MYSSLWGPMGFLSYATGSGFILHLHIMPIERIFHSGLISTYSHLPPTLNPVATKQINCEFQKRSTTSSDGKLCKKPSTSFVLLVLCLLKSEYYVISRDPIVVEIK